MNSGMGLTSLEQKLCSYQCSAKVRTFKVLSLKSLTVQMAFCRCHVTKNYTLIFFDIHTRNTHIYTMYHCNILFLKTKGKCKCVTEGIIRFVQIVLSFVCVLLLFLLRVKQILHFCLIFGRLCVFFPQFLVFCGKLTVALDQFFQQHNTILSRLNRIVTNNHTIHG